MIREPKDAVVHVPCSLLIIYHVLVKGIKCMQATDMSSSCRMHQRVSKPLTAFRSFDNQNRREIAQVPTHSKSVLSAFFPKPKAPKLKTNYVS